MKWKDKIKMLKLEHIKNTAPGFYELSGGDKMKVKGWTDTTANGLTACIVDWINLNGGSATRISTTGQVRKINGEMKWAHGNTRKGTADIHACINGRHCSIEVKIGRDKMSDYQYKEKVRIEIAGGLYFVATNMEDFVSWYNTHFNLK